MKNIIKEKPTDKLFGRLLETTKFVATEDILNKKILDIGCGYGWCELNFLKRGAKEIVASELTAQDLETIQSHIKHPKLKTQVASAIDLPFPRHTFDTVVCWEVIEHIPFATEANMFSEVARILRPGGKFYLSTPFDSWMSKLFDPAWWLIGHRHYSKFQLTKLGDQAGFKLDKIQVRGDWWEVFGILNMYFSKWILHRGPLFASFFNSKSTYEYSRPGRVNIFAKYIKK